MTTKRRTKQDAVDIRCSIDGTKLGELSEKAIQETMRKTGMTREKAADLKLDIHTEDDYGGTVAVAMIYHDRPETDEEIAARLHDERRSTEWERARYEELKKKFEG